jgi:hypothetical protein
VFACILASSRITRSGFQKMDPSFLRWFCHRLDQETRAPHLHMHGANRTRRHPTSRSSGHRVPDLSDHPQSSAPGLLLPPRSLSLPTMSHLALAHHETSKRNSPNETRIKVKQPKCPRFKFKPRQVNDSSQTNQGSDHLVSHKSTSTEGLSPRCSSMMTLPST